jgi:hypothetical protein
MAGDPHQWTYWRNLRKKKKHTPGSLLLFVVVAYLFQPEIESWRFTAQIKSKYGELFISKNK